MGKLLNYMWSKAMYSDFLRNNALKFLRRFPTFIPYPECIEVEVSTACNLKCIMCEHTYWKEPVRNMSFKEFKYIIDQFPKLRWIGLTGIGESFLNPDFLKMIEYVKSKGIWIELYDSFFLINEKISDRLIDLEVNRIYVSIDAATKKTYEKIRVGSNFETVIRHIRHMAEHKGTYPRLDFHYIVSKLNIKELPEFVELVKSFNLDRTEILFTRVLHDFKEVRHLYTEIPNKIIRETERKAKKLEIKIKWGADVPKIKPPVKNCMAWLQPFIFVTGHVIPCCAGNEANKRELQKKCSMGNIFKIPFKDMWNSENYKLLRNCIRNNKMPAFCTSCNIFEAD